MKHWKPWGLVDKASGSPNNPTGFSKQRIKMKNNIPRKKPLALLFLFSALSLHLVLSGCADQKTQAIQDTAATMSTCEKIEALVNAHQNGFEKLRFSQQTTNKMDIWRTRYHLVGDRCQIWSWGAGNTDYVCSLISPNRETAEEHFEKAKAITRQCLDNSWEMSIIPRQIGNGTKAVFAQKDNNTVVATHVVEIHGIFNTEWATYYFVGDHNDQL